MIKVNILPKAEGTGALSVLGVDLSKFNVKFILIAVVVAYGSELPLSIYTSELQDVKEGGIRALKEEEKRINLELSQYKDIEKEIENTTNKEDELSKAKGEIEKKIYNKKNPFRIMVYIGGNIPNNLWIEKLSLSEGEFVIEGSTSSYRSIGGFIDDLKKSVYFDKSLEFDGAETKINEQTGLRIERFKISGKVVKYN